MRRSHTAGSTTGCFPTCPRSRARRRRCWRSAARAAPATPADGRRRDRGRRVAVLRPAHRPRHHRRPLAPSRWRRPRGAAQRPQPEAQPGDASTADGPIGSRTCSTATTRPSSCSARPGEADDVPRNPQGMALIGDPRNDVHLFVSPCTSRCCSAHNRIVDRLRGDGVPEADVFDDGPARDSPGTTSGSSVHDFLPRLVGADAGRGGARRGRPWFYRPAAGRTSRWSSPTRPSATATGRSATPTGSSTAVRRGAAVPRPGRLRAGARRAGVWTGRRSSTCRAGRPRSAPSASTAGSPARSSGCPGGHR